MSDDDGWNESTEGELDWDLTEEAGYGAWEPPPYRRLGPAIRRFALWIMLIAIIGSVLAVLFQSPIVRRDPEPTPTPIFFTRSAPAFEPFAPTGDRAGRDAMLFFARPAPVAPTDVTTTA